MVSECPFEIFGDRALFALELQTRSLHDDIAPLDSRGSWGAWRLWVANINLSNMQLDTASGPVEVAEVRWFLAPLFRWIAENWTPLLHETRLPPGGRIGDTRPRHARAAYLATLESAGDNSERFAPWQAWAARHALQTVAEGGIVPDVFFHRVGDEIEISWGDRVQPGADAATFLAEDGVARASVDAVARVFASSMEWFLEQRPIRQASWSEDIERKWKELQKPAARDAGLYWYLDSTPEPGRLTALLQRVMRKLRAPLRSPDEFWWGSLSPSIAMFGDLSPNISEEAASRLLASYFQAQSDEPESETLLDLIVEEPAWATASPWDNGYSLALSVLEQIDSEHDAAATPIDGMLEALGIVVRDVELGSEGPRGVAFAGPGLRPTILVNTESAFNRGRGRRFTLAHELCHILFDRDRARPLAHASTPWASPSVEKRANAFAAMLLMPPYRAKRPAATNLAELQLGISKLARRLEVSSLALKQHLSNIDEISPFERAHLLQGAIDN